MNAVRAKLAHLQFHSYLSNQQLAWRPYLVVQNIFLFNKDFISDGEETITFDILPLELGLTKRFLLEQFHFL